MIYWLKIIKDKLFLYQANSKSQERKNKGDIIKIWQKNEKVNLREVVKIITGKNYEKISNHIC